MEDEIKKILLNEGKIQAIKAVARRDKCDLETAKWYVEELEGNISETDKSGATTAQEQTAAVEKVKAIGIVMIGAVFIFGMYKCSSGPRVAPSQVTHAASSAAVQNSSWDSSVPQVKAWLQNNLKDPSSLEYIEWSAVQKDSGGGYKVRVKYRSKNSFGGYVVANQLFFMDSKGNVTRYTDL